MNGKLLLCASLFGMLALAIVFSGCEKNDDAKDESVNSVVGTWKYVKHENITEGVGKDVMFPSSGWSFTFREDGTFEEYNTEDSSVSMSGTYKLESNTLSLIRDGLVEQCMVATQNNGQTLEMRWFVYTKADEDSSYQTTFCVSYYEKQ